MRKSAIKKSISGLRSGMTLVEAIVSNLILCGAVVTIGAISTRSLSDIRLNRQYELASSLANRQLTLIDYTGVEEFLQAGQMEGEAESAGKKFTWQAEIEEMGIQNLYLVTVNVSWEQKNRIYNVTVSTRLNGVGSTEETTTTTTETTQQTSSGGQ